MIFAALLLVASVSTIGQQPGASRQLVVIKNHPVAVLVAGQETTFQALILDTAKFSSKVLPGQGNTNAKKQGAMVQLTLKDPKLSLVRINDILTKFSIPEHKRALRICVDKVLIKDPSKLLADLSYIQRVEITTDRYPTYFNEEDTEEEVINIITPRTFSPGT